MVLYQISLKIVESAVLTCLICCSYQNYSHFTLLHGIHGYIYQLLGDTLAHYGAIILGDTPACVVSKIFYSHENEWIFWKREWGQGRWLSQSGIGIVRLYLELIFFQILTSLTCLTNSTNLGQRVTSEKVCNQFLVRVSFICHIYVSPTVVSEDCEGGDQVKLVTNEYLGLPEEWQAVHCFVEPSIDNASVRIHREKQLYYYPHHQPGMFLVW